MQKPAVPQRVSTIIRPSRSFLWSFAIVFVVTPFCNLADSTARNIVVQYLYLGHLKNLVAFILLLAHLNFSMFIAQLDEMDIYDTCGQQKEDVNSIVEYMADVFHIKHKPLKDSDDDNARYFHASKFDEMNFELMGVIKREYFLSQKAKFPIYPEALTGPIYPDIQGPPPKA